ncbi:glycosyltransferase family 2 protein [Paenibacillus sp. SYP-B4298]|uniref:glycosyltransferase family 2 protein n=1 Tax=Paenibacillus sp. SYP-B4298 TaxID=2996034 RepID=UPI0022DDA01D|nr:glycosyltransferase [Paenibacillus sp. SYP-B4298]
MPPPIHYNDGKEHKGGVGIPPITVIIPVHNQAYPLALTLQAFTKQLPPYNQCSIIVVDDGSEDLIHSVVEAYRDSLDIQYVRIAKSGRAAARNAGARWAKEGLIVFCDADRMPRPDFLQSHVEASKRYDSSIMIGQVREIYVTDPERNRKIIEERLANHAFSRIPQYCRLVYQLFDDAGACQSGIPWVATFSGNMSMPVDLFHSLGGFDEQFQEWGFEHFELGYRACQGRVPFVYAQEAINVHLAHHRQGTSYRNYMTRSHRYFYEKHSEPVVMHFLSFMLGEISLKQLEDIEQTGQLMPHKEDSGLKGYVRITQM